MLKAGLVGLLLIGLTAAGSQMPHAWGLVVRMLATDEVHYGGHLLAGRLLSLCPFTADLAEIQYARGLHHARTPAEAARLTTQRPATTRARLAEVPLLVAEAVRQVAGVVSR